VLLAPGPRGTGFQVSGAGANRLFGNLNPQYPAVPVLTAFSTPKVFASLGNPTYDLVFQIPGSPVAATTRGVGIVFTDVDTRAGASVALFDIAGRGLGRFRVPATPGDGSLSFLGLSVPTATIARARVTAGTAAIGPDDVTQVPGNPDIVAIDTVDYGEPVPPPVPDLAIRFRAPSTVRLGETIGYTVLITNQGGAPARDVAVAPLLPPGTELVDRPPSTVVDLLAGDDAATFRTIVRPTRQGTVTATTRARTASPTPLARAVSATLRTRVTAPFGPPRTLVEPQEVVVSTAGLAALRLGCPGRVDCIIDAGLRRAGTLASGSGSFRVAAGRFRLVSIQMTPATVTLLRRGPLTLRARAEGRRAGSAAGTTRTVPVGARLR
jgi:uncharacterized repeat protein (TIGR01451 family)